jgi:integrase/recombinase XerD
VSDADPSLADLLAGAYPESMRVRSYSSKTIETQVMLMRWFRLFLAERSITHPAQVTQQHIERYQHHLFMYRSNANGQHEQPLTIRSQHMRLWAIVRFFRWAHRTRLCPQNPANIEMPRLPRPLPRPALTALEVERIVALPDVTTPQGLRDRTMLEVLYATGMRRGELCSLRVEDIDHGRGVVNIREGKGRKGRVVPISQRALSWVTRYVVEVWYRFPTAKEHRLLFILVDNTRQHKHRGKPITPAVTTINLGGYLVAAGIEKAGACHIYRRTAATLMMENGADIRAIQDLLGHSEIKTVGIYTNVSLKFLKEQHAKTHPSAMVFLPPPPPPA